MAKYIAFLKAINVGGHTVKMDHLKNLFEKMGFENVETFIASGNVVFETKSKTFESIKKKIETKLKRWKMLRMETTIRNSNTPRKIILKRCP